MARREPICSCIDLPRDRETGQLLARCNVCWNDLIEGKNELVRENNGLRGGCDERQANQ